MWKSARIKFFTAKELKGFSQENATKELKGFSQAKYHAGFSHDKLKNELLNPIL